MFGSPSAILFCVVFIFFATAPAPAADPLPRLHAQGTRFVDPQGHPVTLRGVNLGNWLLIEPGVFQSAFAFRDQETLFDTLRDRFGEAERWRLINVYRDHFITDRDFDTINAFKLNFIRVGFDYDTIEDDAKPMELREGAFKHLDFAVAEAEKHGLYVLIDLHGAQGRTVRGKQSGRIGPAEFWTNADNQKRALWLWENVAKRYKGRTNILGYEALNEPWGGTRENLRDFCVRWYPVMRAADPDAILIMPAWSDGIALYGKPKDNGWTNAGFDMHFYPGVFGRNAQSTPATHWRFLAQTMPLWRDKVIPGVDAPLVIGEMNVVFKHAGGGEMMRRYFDAANDAGFGICIWTLKELRPDGGVHDAMWMLETNAQPLPQLDLKTSSKEEIEALFTSLSTMPLVQDDDLKHWLTTSESPAATQPSTPTPRP